MSSQYLEIYKKSSYRAYKKNRKVEKSLVIIKGYSAPG